MEPVVSAAPWPRCEAGGIGIGRQPTDAGMKSHGVVVAPPLLEGGLCLVERREQRLVQELVAQAAIEALDEGILHRLARGDCSASRRRSLSAVQVRRECQINCVRGFHGGLSSADCSRQALGKEDDELGVGGAPFDGGLPVNAEIP